jgi:hypothetical protein
MQRFLIDFIITFLLRLFISHASLFYNAYKVCRNDAKCDIIHHQIIPGGIRTQICCLEAEDMYLPVDYLMLHLHIYVTNEKTVLKNVCIKTNISVIIYKYYYFIIKSKFVCIPARTALHTTRQHKFWEKKCNDHEHTHPGATIAWIFRVNKPWPPMVMQFGILTYIIGGHYSLEE